MANRQNKSKTKLPDYMLSIDPIDIYVLHVFEHNNTQNALPKVVK